MGKARRCRRRGRSLWGRPRRRGEKGGPMERPKNVRARWSCMPSGQSLADNGTVRAEVGYLLWRDAAWRTKKRGRVASERASELCGSVSTKGQSPERSAINTAWPCRRRAALAFRSERRPSVLWNRALRHTPQRTHPLDAPNSSAAASSLRAVLASSSFLSEAPSSFASAAW